MFDPIAIGLTALIVTAGAALQGAVGFGMGLVVVPLLLWTGRSLPEAVAVLLGAAVVQTAYGTWMCRRDIPWKLTIKLAAVQWICVPIGVLGMGALAAAGPAVVKQCVGAIVVGLLLLRAVLKPQPRERVSMGWGVLAAALAGLLAGLVGMGGPPIVLFSLAHDWSKDTFRGFLWATFLLVLPAACVALALRMGVEILQWSALGLVLFPVLWAGSRAGFAVSKHWDAARMRQVATGLQVLIAGWSIIGPLLAAD